MRLTQRDLFLEDVCKRFYVEKQSKTLISKITGLSRNTVRKYLNENPKNSELVQRLISIECENRPQTRENYQFPNFQVALQNAITKGDSNIKHLNLVETISRHAEELGIVSTSDLIKLEIAYENFLNYRCMSKRFMELNGQCLDVSWLESTDKMSKLTSRFAESAQKFLKIFNQMIKELEIKYGKRSPDFGRVHNLNYQRNEINVDYVSSGTLQDQVLEA